MGIYVYTMRARTVKIVKNGDKFDANIMMFASRLFDLPLFANTDEKRRHQLYENRLNVAKETAQKPRSGYVALVSDDDGKPVYSGACVYENVTKGVWYDSDKFPGRLIGYLAKRGRNWTVVDTHDWIEEGKTRCGDNVWVAQRYRQTVDIPASLVRKEYQYQTKEGRWVDDLDDACGTYEAECQV